VAWKLQEEVDQLTEQLNLEYKAKLDAEKLAKQLEVQLGDYKETMEEAGMSRARIEALVRDLQTEIEELQDILQEEEERNRELSNQQPGSSTSYRQPT